MPLLVLLLIITSGCNDAVYCLNGISTRTAFVCLGADADEINRQRHELKEHHELQELSR